MISRRTDQRTEFEQQAVVHLGSLYGAAYRLTRNPRDAEDLVQDTMVRAYRFWASYQAGTNCKAWLFRILTNTFINEYQRKKRSRQVLDAATGEQDSVGGVFVDADAHARRDPETLMIENTISDDVQRALDELPEDFRVAVVLCDVQGLSYKEIAEIVECPVGTVMSRLFRGRRLLEASLRDYAAKQGLVRSESKDITTNDDPIDLAAYRNSTRKESR